jgi:hypothetical protein
MVREMVIASLLATPVVASHTGEVVILVFNYSEAPAAVLAAAELEVTAIYARAGVSLKWLSCAGMADLDEAATCAQKLNPGGPVIALRIVPYLAIDPRNTARNGSNVLGYSSGVYTTVSYKQSWKVSAMTGEPREHVLACAIAHELGHVFLGPESHSHLGLMQGDAKSMLRAVRQGFAFSSSEVARFSLNAAFR